jgi:hypothetical protein
MYANKTTLLPVLLSTAAQKVASLSEMLQLATHQLLSVELQRSNVVIGSEQSQSDLPKSTSEYAVKIDCFQLGNIVECCCFCC